LTERPLLLKVIGKSMSGLGGDRLGFGATCADDGLLGSDEAEQIPVSLTLQSTLMILRNCESQEPQCAI